MKTSFEINAFVISHKIQCQIGKLFQNILKENATEELDIRDKKISI